jgi:tRNA (mo5U34)-methyltransferase
VRCVDVDVTSTDEQRKTDWMDYQSLSDFLDPKDSSKTIEGYQRPTRAVMIAKRP